MGASEDWIFDVAEADFEREVLETSSRVPVVVDFWAPWCGPCRALAPILEKLVTEQKGEILLARVNIDEAQELAQLLRVTSIPAVKAFRDGRLVDEFLGAQPEGEVRAFLGGLLPSEADRQAQAGHSALSEGDPATALSAFRAALESDPRCRAAQLGLARCFAETGDSVAALGALEPLLPGDPEAEQMAAALRLHGGGDAGGADLNALRARVETDSDDQQARLECARALVIVGCEEEAFGLLLGSVERDPHWSDDVARQVMLDLFATLGSEHELTQRFRPALARVLFR